MIVAVEHLVNGYLMLIRLGCRRYGKLRSFFSSAIAPNTFLREVPLTGSVSSSARFWQMLIYLSANSSPFGPLQPTRRADWLRPRLGSSHRIYGLFRVGPSGRDLELHWATRIEQPPTNLVLWRLLILR